MQSSRTRTSVSLFPIGVEFINWAVLSFGLMTRNSETFLTRIRSGETAAWWAFGALALSGLTIGLDATVLNIALPRTVDVAACVHRLAPVVQHRLHLGSGRCHAPRKQFG